MAMMNELETTDKPHDNDVIRIQHAHRKASPIHQTYNESVQLVVAGTTIVEQETLKQKEGNVNIHFNASTEIIIMICKLIESVSHCCILFAVMKYMDDLLEKTIIEAQESNSTHVKLTPREEVCCLVPEADDPLAKKLFCSKMVTKRGEHVLPTTARTAAGRHFVLSTTDTKLGTEIIRINNEKIVRKASSQSST